MKKLIFILGMVLIFSYIHAQVEADSTIVVRTTEYSNRYSYKNVDHSGPNRKPGWASPDIFVDTPPDVHPKLQEALNKSLLPETLNKLNGKSISFSFNIYGNGKIKSIEIIVPKKRLVELSKKECHELITNIKKANIVFITDENTKKKSDVFIAIIHKVE